MRARRWQVHPAMFGAFIASRSGRVGRQSRLSELMFGAGFVGPAANPAVREIIEEVVTKAPRPARPVPLQVSSSTSLLRASNWVVATVLGTAFLESMRIKTQAEADARARQQNEARRQARLEQETITEVTVTAPRPIAPTRTLPQRPNPFRDLPRPANDPYYNPRIIPFRPPPRPTIRPPRPPTPPVEIPGPIITPPTVPTPTPVQPQPISPPAPLPDLPRTPVPTRTPRRSPRRDPRRDPTRRPGDLPGSQPGVNPSLQPSIRFNPNPWIQSVPSRRPQPTQRRGRLTRFGESPLPLPQTDPARRRCPPCKKKEEKEEERTQCYKKLVKESRFASDDESYNWVAIDCDTGREI